MAASAALYTPEVLARAVELSAYPLAADLPLRGAARSQSCGSSLELGLAVDGVGRIERLGLRSHACAIGQAAAAIFAAAAPGRDRAGIAAAERALSAWLAGGELPDWPGLEQLARARDYPGRHGALLLPWRAALDALSSNGRQG
jgi:NifU-like protein involved in Fe-S cluster formation